MPKGGESLGNEESSEEEEEVVPALILVSGARPLAPDAKSRLSFHTSKLISPELARSHTIFISDGYG